MLSAVIIVIVLAVSVLALNAMRSKVRFKVSATALRWFSLTIEVNPNDDSDLKQLAPSSGTAKQHHADVKGPTPEGGRGLWGWWRVIKLRLH